MKKTLLCTCLLALSLGANAQDNHGYGASDDQFKSLAEEVANLKKHNDMLNVYINYAASGQIQQDADHKWGTGFANKQLRLEIKGNLTDKLYYRLRHRLNKSNVARGEDNFAKATDIMMIGYKFSDKLKVEGGKLCQSWGGFEFDENPMYIYEFSDMVGTLDNYMAGVSVAYNPIPSQEFVFQLTNSHNEKFDEVYGDNAVSTESNNTYRQLERSRNPLTYIFNWNGSFFDNKLQTRWSWGLQGEARHKYSKMLFLGQKLNLDKLQWYFDYMGSFDGVDRLGIATNDLEPVRNVVGADKTWFSDVHYNSFVTKLNWQFAPKWNLMLKGMYETASVTKVPELKNYRKSYGYVGSIEYYPVKSQDFRLFLAYVGRKFTFNEASNLSKYNTNRIELGFMYRIKAY